MNPKLSPKERNLIKGAIRRIFARSELRRKVVEKTLINHYDDSRKRVKNWCLCPSCNKPTPKSYMQADHLLPVVRLNEEFSEMSLDLYIERLWCAEDNLQAICIECHLIKSKDEKKQRTLIKREKKKLKGELK